MAYGTPGLAVERVEKLRRRVVEVGIGERVEGVDEGYRNLLEAPRRIQGAAEGDGLAGSAEGLAGEGDVR